MAATILQLLPLLFNLFLFNILNLNKVVEFILVLDLFDFSSGHVLSFHSSNLLVKGIAKLFVHVSDVRLTIFVQFADVV